jgi:iron complex transport system substrate-binding protein
VSRLPLAARSLRRLVSLCLIATVVLGACGPSAGSSPAGGAAAPTGMPAPQASPSVPPAVFPVTLTDDTGRQVQVAREPRRIVSAAPSNTEIVYALGLGDRLVAVTNLCDYPEDARSKPKIGGMRPNAEAIVAQQPDLVLGVRGLPADVIAALEGQQIPVAVFNPPDFAGVLADIRAVGRLTGATAAAERVAGTMQQRWRAVEEKAKTAATRPTVFYEIDATNPAAVSAAGPGTFFDAMISTAGGVNVLAALTPGQQYPRVSAEVLLAANPQLIILDNALYGESAETLARRPGWNAIEAVQRGAIVGIPDPNVTSRAGPRLVEGLEIIAKAIHPELFGPPPPMPTRAPAG